MSILIYTCTTWDNQYQGTGGHAGVLAVSGPHI